MSDPKTPTAAGNPTADTAKPLVAELLANRPFDGTMKRLEVHAEIPGYRIQWCNDEGSRIHNLIRWGWEFVKASEVALNDRTIDGNQAVDDKVKRAVGRSNGPDARYAYLMKCAEDHWQQFQAAMQARPDAFDAMLLKGFADPNAGQYNPTSIANKIDQSEFMQDAPGPRVGGMSRTPHRMGGPSVRNR